MCHFLPEFNLLYIRLCINLWQAITGDKEYFYKYAFMFIIVLVETFMFSHVRILSFNVSLNF